MSEVSEKIVRIDVREEFRVCASCGYERGFHGSFLPLRGIRKLRLILICPNCGARYDINRSI